MNRDTQFDKLLALAKKIASKHNWAMSDPRDPCPTWVGDADIIEDARAAVGPRQIRKCLECDFREWADDALWSSGVLECPECRGETVVYFGDAPAYHNAISRKQ